MQMGGIVSGALFLVGLGAIFTSSGAFVNMLGGDILIAAAGIALILLSKEATVSKSVTA
jgi:NADH:ubiquinone oxidoreductase subunit K